METGELIKNVWVRVSWYIGKARNGNVLNFHQCLHDVYLGKKREYRGKEKKKKKYLPILFKLYCSMLITMFEALVIKNNNEINV